MLKNILADIDHHLDRDTDYRVGVLITHIVIVIGVCMVIFQLKAPLLFNGLDGAFLRTVFQKQMEWTIPSLTFTVNPLQGMGTLYYLNPWFSPALSSSFLLFGGEIHPVVVYTIVSLELFLSVIFLGFSFRLNASAVYLAAWGLTLCALPFVSVYRLYPIAAMQPIYGELFAAQSFIVGLYNLIGRVSFLRSFVCGLTILGLFLVEVLEFPYHLSIYGPVVFVFFFAMFLHASKVERRAKGLFLIIAAVLCTFIVCFFIGQILYTMSLFYGKELLQCYSTEWAFISIVFHDDSIGKPLFYLYLFGAILVLLRHSGMLRLVALLSLILTGLILLTGLIFHVFLTRYQGPPTLYIEFYLWPYYFLLSGYALVYMAWFLGAYLQAANLFHASRFAKMHRWRVHPLTLVPPAAVMILAFGTAPGDNPWPFPPRKTEIVSTLEKEVSLRPGTLFRGYVATLTGFDDKPKGVTWSDITTFDHNLNKAVGNDYRTVGLWHYGIPTLFEYTSLITPPYYFMMTRLLTRPQDKQIRGVLILTKFEERYLQSLGVRFVITDYPIERPMLLSEPGLEGGLVRLYELPDANLGGYSPVRPILRRTPDEALAEIHSESFDFHEDLVVSEPLPLPLVHAAAVRTSYLGDGMRVTASSPGASLLLLPLQYSHCLRLTVCHADSTEQPRLYRVNVLQAGLYFQGNVEIDLTAEYGPFLDTLCRLEDSRDFWQLGSDATH